MLLTCAAALPLSIWIYLVFFRGGYWRVRKNLIPFESTAGSAKRVVAVIPARDEAAVIGRAVASLLQQQLAIPLEVVVVDDGSADGTAQVAQAAASAINAGDRLTVIPAGLLPPGWTGKLWALSKGVAEAHKLRPDYLLFTDADIEHGLTAVNQLLHKAEAGGFDLTSLMVKLACDTRAEMALIPAFVYFFFQLYPPAWIESRQRATAGAAGGCILIRTAALEQCGGLSTIRGAVIDDCALAGLVKSSGGAVWLGLTDSAVSLRNYGTMAEVGSMISRTAFHQLRHSSVLLLFTLIGLFATYLLPPVLTFTAPPRLALVGLAVWVLMSVTYVPMLRFYRLSTAWAAALPLVALFYSGATAHSAWRYWRGQGGVWKGRVQDVRKR